MASIRPELTAAVENVQRKVKPHLLEIPNDVLAVIVRHLRRGTVHNLRLACKGLYASPLLEEAMYKSPFHVTDWEEDRLTNWEFRGTGRIRWNVFKASVNDTNRHYIKAMACSHWFSLDDFRWLDENLPQVHILDLSDIKDFMWTMDPDIHGETKNIWRWKELAEACPGLFARLHHLLLYSWVHFSGHDSISLRYSYSNPEFAEGFRLSRRVLWSGEHSGHAAEVLLKACTHLRILSIRGCLPLLNSWSASDVHERICQLVNPLAHVPDTLTTLKVHYPTPFLAVLLQRLAKILPASNNLKKISISLEQWFLKARGQTSNPPARVHSGPSWDTFGGDTFASCDCDHEQDAHEIVQNSCDTFGQLLRHIYLARRLCPGLVITTHDGPKEVNLSPLQLVNLYKPHQALARNPDIFIDAGSVDTVAWLSSKMNWKPNFSWDPLMNDDFPKNLGRESHRSYEFESDIIGSIRTAFESLRKMGLPLRITIGDRELTSIRHHISNQHLYFIPTKTRPESTVATSPNEIWKPCEARFSLSAVAPLIDDLTIKYPYDMPDIIPPFSNFNGIAPAERAVLKRERLGWRKFWARYAPLMTNLKRLEVNIPRDIFADWGKSRHLIALLDDPAWEVLEHEEDVGQCRSCEYRVRFPFTRLTFFRRGALGAEVGQMGIFDTDLVLPIDPYDNERRDISADDLRDAPHDTVWHKFFQQKDTTRKRKHEEEDDDAEIHAHDGKKTTKSRQVRRSILQSGLLSLRAQGTILSRLNY